ncbi:hypothetical protein FNF27_06225 [Cafeteria roenbergensis]|uniref:ESCRT-II complex subunit VPS25 n=1 Tax=Cafeteria roenbergensis TaxID=33653 RepID=A0A5A8CBC7_CAFRO|nr:hypothetical protein FNF29_05597 [Cafeteria roenbergensis]KAA0150524.1 hypothetical protein FNF31_07006 [Cafeteria roenbergensis]KAA0161891.1 hypothetical protein FNF28_04888 [Cafeteria roenbergensis]KAA0171718.1 hypothetical protein FNF27_06225 [Cafeteria roenbergensis]|eukprot:KAA0149977.1 hypothetical protein FNF29_05597 [Cafeteria roenbergensis]
MAAPAAERLPAIYQFPPFFTLQTNDALRAKQLGEWRNIIVQWHEARKEATMHVADWPLWENKDIGRRMSAEGIAAVMRFVKEGGNCEWVDAAKTTARIFYKTPSQWAAAVHEYVDGAGLAGTMCIVYDLISGDTTTDAPFYGLDAATMIRALDVLEAEGKAEVFRQEALDETGVKFKPRS